MSANGDILECRRMATFCNVGEWRHFGTLETMPFPVIPLRTARDLGAFARDRRKRLGVDQASLAAKVGVSRSWLIDFEKGKPRSELGLVLRTLAALGLVL